MFYQGSLLGGDMPAVPADGAARITRIALDERSWIDHFPGWLRGAETLFDQLVTTLTWRQRTDIAMYDPRVDEPRLTYWWHAFGTDPVTLPVLGEIRRHRLQPPPRRQRQRRMARRPPPPPRRRPHRRHHQRRPTPAPTQLSARRSAVEARTQATNKLEGRVGHVDDDLRHLLSHRRTLRMAKRSASVGPTDGTKRALRSLARPGIATTAAAQLPVTAGAKLRYPPDHLRPGLGTEQSPRT